jgi:hypothetical protein
MTQTGHMYKKGFKQTSARNNRPCWSFTATKYVSNVMLELIYAIYVAPDQDKHEQALFFSIIFCQLDETDLWRDLCFKILAGSG